MNNLFLRFLFLSSIFILAGGAYFIGKTSHQRWFNHCVSSHKFINFDVLCGEPDVIKKTGYIKTQQDILEYVEKEKTNKKVSLVSVYFRDLVHGPVLGVNEEVAFAPASFFKLPLAIVFLHQAEKYPNLLSTKIIYPNKLKVFQQMIPPAKSAQANKEYTLEELLRLMLIYSDNNSYEILESVLFSDSQLLDTREQIFQELGLIDPKDRIEEVISVKGYASLFRILYNISYLDSKYSELLLSWLVESEYREGLVAGVPVSVPVAHKFSERIFADKTKQLADCGVVYYPGNPYLICIMTQGDDLGTMTKVIGDISKMLYTEVDSRRL